MNFYWSILICRLSRNCKTHSTSINKGAVAILLMIGMWHWQKLLNFAPSQYLGLNSKCWFINFSCRFSRNSKIHSTFINKGATTILLMIGMSPRQKWLNFASLQHLYPKSQCWFINFCWSVTICRFSRNYKIHSTSINKGATSFLLMIGMSPN